MLIVDIRMPSLDGIEFVRRLRGADNHTPVIMLTTFDAPGQLREAFRAGAQGYLLKGASAEELSEAIRSVAAGGHMVLPLATRGLTPPSLPAGATPCGVSLTEREIDVLRLAAAGNSNKEIAAALGLVEGTVKNYVSHVMQRLGARDRTHAVLLAIQAKLI